MGKPVSIVAIAITRKRARRYEFENARVVLTQAPVSLCRPTPDRHDKAHAVRDPAGWLVPGVLVKNATPRHYHPSQVTSRGMPFDSAYDEWDRTARTLEAAGINVGRGAARFIGASCEAREMLAAEVGGPRALRDRLHQKTTCEMTQRERDLENAASMMLAARKRL